MEFQIFEDGDHLMEYYQIQADDFRMRHTAIWTEVQHYTWVLSVLLGAGPISAISETTLNSTQLGYLFFLPLIGIFVAIMAFFIIKRDFVYYNRADARLLYIERKLGVLSETDYLDARLKRGQKEDFNVSRDVSEQTPISPKALFKPRIRALILGIFLIYIVAGVLEIAYFAYLLLF
jgi:phosphate/sulfate permease